MREAWYEEAMGLLTEAGLDELVAGCADCGGKRLRLRSYCDARVRVMLGDVDGGYGWAYDGEKFVDGVFAADCLGCGRSLFASDCCPRCNAPGKLAEVLAAENREALPERCPVCDELELTVTALVPIEVTTEGKRMISRTCAVELHDPGFHVLAASCDACEQTIDVTDHCPLCAAPGPLRARP
jgi:hypothetical protein